MTTSDRLTRFSSKLIEAAEYEAQVQNRSVRQQLEHWARFGRSFAAESSPAYLEAVAALEGSRPVESLSPVASKVFDAELDARVEERLARTDLSRPENQEPTQIGSLEKDPDGSLYLVLPDGSRLLAGKADQ